MMHTFGKAILDGSAASSQKNLSRESMQKLDDFVKNHKEEEYNEQIIKADDWSVLYHFSHIRKNLISWIPFQGSENVLEIGSECGAITGELLKRAAHVTAIEPDPFMCQCNMQRHLASERLTIIGNDFNYKEDKADQQFDYIFLVSNSAGQYLRTGSDASRFIKTLSAYLKDSGKIIIAMPNRLGMKYWAGCAEDNYGIPFEGLEGYRHSEKIQTYSITEWKEIINASGDWSTEVYFPEPDYRFPMTIYSEERQPGLGELRQTYFNFEHIRLQLFEDSAVNDSVIQNGLYEQFADSYLLILSKNKKIFTERIIYSKFSNDRAQEFAIRTDIVKLPDDSFAVKKVPLSDEAREHVLQLKEIEEKLEKQYKEHGALPNRCTIQDGSAYFEFIKGKTLEEELDEYLGRKQYDLLENRLLGYLAWIQKIHSTEEFYPTDRYDRVFGHNQPEPGSKCAALSNIDLIVGNLILTEDQNWVIDYEWTFDFPIPEKYIRYRVLHYYLESDSKRNILKARNLYQKAGFSEKNLEVFERMEQCFQKYLQGKHVALRDMYAALSPGTVSIQEMLANRIQEISEQRLQVFFDDGKGFREEYSVKYRIKEDTFESELLLPEKTKAIRLDPGEKICALRVQELSLNGKNVEYTTNGYCCEGGLWYFPDGDPQIYVGQLSSKTNRLIISAIFENREAAASQMMKELQKLRQELQEMKDTKVWKLYQKVKHHS